MADEQPLQAQMAFAIRALTNGLPLSRLDKAQTSLALYSLLHRFR